MGVTVFCTSKTLIRAALWQRTERDDFHFLNWWQQVVVMRLHTGHNLLNAHMFRKMKLAPSPAAVLKTTQPNMYCSNAHFCKQQDKMCGQQQYSYTPTHQLLRQQWGTGEDGHIQLAGWTLSVVAVDKEEQKKNKAPSCIHWTVWRAGLITECEGTYFAPFFFFPAVPVTDIIDTNWARCVWSICSLFSKPVQPISECWLQHHCLDGKIDLVILPVLPLYVCWWGKEVCVCERERFCTQVYMHCEMVVLIAFGMGWKPSPQD